MPVYLMPKVDEIMATDSSDIEKLAQAFSYLVEQHINMILREQELQKAVGEDTALVKLQIQAGTMEYVFGMFRDCYQRATGKKVPHG